MNLQQAIAELPGVKEILARHTAEEAERLAGRRQALLLQIREAEKSALGYDREIEVQRPKADAAEERYRKEADKLGALTCAKQEANAEISRLLTSLASDPDLGEAEVERAVCLLDSARRSVALTMQEVGAKDPASIRDIATGIILRRGPETAARLEELRRKHVALDRAYARAVELRMAPLSPPELAKRVAAIMQLVEEPDA